MISSFKQVSALLHQALFDHSFSGASLLVFYQGEVLFQEELGYTSFRIDGLIPSLVGPETLFDLASLTKPLVTAFLYSILLQEEKISLEDTMGDFLDTVSSEEKRRISLKALLNHSAGLPDWKPYFSELLPDDVQGKNRLDGNGKSLLYQKIHEEPCIYPPGERSLYSDLGYILLGEILETLSNLDLDQLFFRDIIQPLGIKDLGFVPLNRSKGPKWPPSFGRNRDFMATEKSEIRKKVIQGEVHDDNAYVMGGVAGHAGLFGTARSVYSCLSEWTNAYWNRGAILHSSTVKEFVDRARFPADWGLGWMFPSVPSTSGNHFSKQSFGHLGFTGTSIWYDPQADLGVIFLTNRVHPSRANQNLKTLRPLLHDHIYQAVIHEKV